MATVHFGRLQGAAGFARSVAIKRLHPQYAKDPDFVSMFIDEARLAARISHPNVVPTLDVVTQDDQLLLVMEYVRGTSLSRLLRTLRAKGELVPPRIAASIVAGVLRGLHAAHEARSEIGHPLGIVHRDVSPQNVLVGTDGVPRVLDFGVAKAAGRWQSTREGQLKGKIAYMAPEQITTGIVTRQTDLYAAAAVLWETLTGRRMFRAENDVRLLAMVLSGAVTPPSAIVPGLPRGFDTVVLRGLDRDPSRRFATAREMASAIEAVVGAAAPAEVGEWLERVAADELRERANRIEEIERSMPSSRSAPSTVSSTQSSVAAPASGLARRAAEQTLVEPLARLWGGPVASPGPTSTLASAGTAGGSRRLWRRAAAVLAATLAVCAGGAAGYSALRAPHEGPLRETNAASPGTAGTPAERSPRTLQATGEATTPPPSSAWTAIPFPSTLAPATSRPSPPTGPNALPVRATRAAKPTGPAKPLAPPDCTPPYTTDSKGHVHFKPACVN
jgi:eukaryotic-like serine/threonine-protein kinase